MKAGKEHVAALSKAATSVFKRAQALRIANIDLKFPGAPRGKPMSDIGALPGVEALRAPQPRGGGHIWKMMSVPLMIVSTPENR
jgi:hypothetical protein